jgi:hypothetical protein
MKRILLLSILICTLITTCTSCIFDPTDKENTPATNHNSEYPLSPKKQIINPQHDNGELPNYNPTTNHKYI